MGLRVVEVYEGEVDHDAPLLARELVRLGVDVAVVCPPGAAGAFVDTGAEVTPLAVGTGVGSLTALRRVLRGDVLHAHGLRAAVAIGLARSGGTPVVVSLTEAPSVTGAAALVTRAVIRGVFPSAAAVLAPTPEVAAAAAGFGAREVRLVVPPLPDPLAAGRTPEQVREELALAPDGPIVLAVARLHPGTRLDVLVSAAQRWRRREREPQVVLVGVGPAYRALVAQATVARAPVTFAGDRAVDVGPGQVLGDRPATAASRLRLRRGPDTARTASVAAVTAAAGDAADGEEPVVDSLEERASLDDLLAAASVAVVTDPRARPGFALAAARAGVPVVVPAGGVVAGLLGDAVTAVPAGDPDALAAAVRSLLDGGARPEAGITDWPDAAAVAGELVALYEAVSRTTPAAGSDTPG